MNEKELIENLVHPDTMYRKQIEDLEQQLATYKQKEDKLKSAIAKLLKDEYIELFANEYVRSCLDDFLEILNEGDK